MPRPVQAATLGIENWHDVPPTGAAIMFGQGPTAGASIGAASRSLGNRPSGRANTPVSATAASGDVSDPPQPADPAAASAASAIIGSSVPRRMIGSLPSISVSVA